MKTNKLKPDQQSDQHNSNSSNSNFEFKFSKLKFSKSKRGLSAEAIRDIRTSKLTKEELGREYNLLAASIRAIQLGHTYKTIYPELIHKAKRNNNILIIYNGKALTLREWGKELGISYNVLYSRYRRNLSNEEVLGFKVRKCETEAYKNLDIKTLECNGRILTYRDWSILSGTPIMRIYGRINNNGWGIEAAIFAKKGQREEDYNYRKRIREIVSRGTFKDIGIGK